MTRRDLGTIKDLYLYISQRFPLKTITQHVTLFLSTPLTRHWSCFIACISYRVSALDNSVSTEMLQPLCHLVAQHYARDALVSPGPGVTNHLGCGSRASRQPLPKDGILQRRPVSKGRVGGTKRNLPLLDPWAKMWQILPLTRWFMCTQACQTLHMSTSPKGSLWKL